MVQIIYVIFQDNMIDKNYVTFIIEWDITHLNYPMYS